MSDEVTQPIESTEQPEPESSQVLPVETLPMDAPVNAEPVLEGANNITPEVEIPKTEEVIIEAPVEVAEQKPEPVVEEIQPPSPLVRGNDTPLSSPLDAISLAFKNNMARARELLVKARMSIQIKKKKKLEKVMNLFLTKKKIKNSDVRDALHVTDETATVYLNLLKKEGKIQPNGKGGWIYYTKV